MRASQSRQVLFMFMQDAIIFASIALALYLRLVLWGPEGRFDPFQFDKVVSVVILFVNLKLTFHYFELYDIRLHMSLRSFVLGLLKALLVAQIVQIAIYYLFPDYHIGRGVLLMTVVVTLVTVPLFRYLYFYLSGDTAFTQNILIVGTGETAKTVIDEVEKYPFSGYTIAGMIDNDPARMGGEFEGYQVIGTPEHLRELAENRDVDMIVVALSEQRGRLPINPLIDCKMRGIAVVNDTAFHEQFTGKIMVEHLRPSFLIFSDGFKISRSTLYAKRMTDVAVSSILLLLASPAILLSAALVKLTSPGPILYRQVRTGIYGKPFTLFKLRSMVQDSETKSGPVWAQQNDARVTTVGRILRRFRLDELPQIFNILKGEMSFVGPRPERPFFVEQLSEKIPHYKQRFVIKPGLTGWAQIRYPYGNSVEDAREKLQYDLYYIKNLSILFDLRIISETTKVVLGKMGEGTY